MIPKSHARRVQHGPMNLRLTMKGHGSPEDIWKEPSIHLKVTLSTTLAQAVKKVEQKLPP